MPIKGIHVLFEVEDNASPQLQKIAVELLVEAHRRGEHTYGKMHRACPLCQK